MKETRRNLVGFPLLYAMILLAALFLTLFGAQLYRAVTNEKTQNDLQRSALAYTQSKLQAVDAAGGIQIVDGPEGDVLLLAEGDSGYETRIYLWEGAIREELSLCGSALSPETALSICTAGSFTAVQSAPSLLTITVEGRDALCYLRSEGGPDGE